MIPQYVSAQELAVRLGVSANWVYQYAATGDLPSVKIHGVRRFREDEVLAWLEENSEGKGLAEVHQLREVGS